MISLELLLQGLVVGVTVIMMGFVWRLSRQIRRLREGKEDLNRYIELFEASTQRAQDAARHLQHATDKTGDHMVVRLKEAEKAAKVLEALIRQAADVQALLEEETQAARGAILSWEKKIPAGINPRGVDLEDRRRLRHDAAAGIKGRLQEEHQATAAVEKILRHAGGLKPSAAAARPSGKAAAAAVSNLGAASQTLDLIFQARRRQKNSQSALSSNESRPSGDPQEWPQLIEETEEIAVPLKHVLGTGFDA